MLAKAGFFKVAALFVAKFAKVFIVGGVALVAVIAKFLGKKKAA